MTNIDIYNKWSEFRNEYPKYTLLNEELWLLSFYKTIDYIETKKCLPIRTSTDKEIKVLSKWLQHQ